MRARDNIERAISDYSTTETREWYAELEAEAQARAHRAYLLGRACQAIRDMGEGITNEEVRQAIQTLACTAHKLPAERELLEVCEAHMECMQ
jgi:pyruvate dehydrogenase complex dehydrogenase (E1) component